MDFTLTTYKCLLTSFQSNGFLFQALKDFIEQPSTKVIVLRHDIDKLPVNALKMAQLESEMGVSAVYYFRTVQESWDEPIMNQIVSLGHELGYHYEDLSLAGGDYTKAIRHFENQLVRFRQIYPVKTICMHGSPLSKYDNRDLWTRYNYREFGIIGEPYFDIDYHKVFYITDTGRKWNTRTSSVRDLVASGFDIPIKNSYHLISLAEQHALPDHLMITVHPQRWHNSPLPWITELLWQNIKNIFKVALIKMRMFS